MTSYSETTSPVPESQDVPYLHPLQNYKVRETHKALIDSDITTGRKLINQYEVIEEIGRGMHGKVKLARNLETGENVAIKIIPRFSKKRRLGKVTAMSPEDKTKKEIAILKKIRHPNVVALLEVIDDPELKKIYMVLEHAEYGEIIWRKKGLPHICQYERRRIEREVRGEQRSEEEERYEVLLEQRQALKELKRAKMAQNYGPSEYWSVEYGGVDEPSSSYGQRSRVTSKEDFSISDGASSLPDSRHASRGPSRTHSLASVGMPMMEEPDEDEMYWSGEDMETPGPLRSNPNSATALDGTMYGPYVEEAIWRGRRPSMADSIISHMSSVDYYPQTHDPFADDYSYVPCFSMDQARSTFRDTLLGLEYLHYQGVVHRDIKPANLLWSKNHRVKISDFGVSYFGRPIRDGENDETVSESEAKDFDDDLELAKTVGTPAFFAPELCYTDVNMEQPKVSEQIDVWSLGVTLYCLIFARIPFLAEDEFQMFRKIATEEVYIPRRRLAPVDPSTSPVTTSLYQRHNNHPYRNDNDLEYEEIDPQLHNLLGLMLTKNPEDRIRLRDIKRHPWVIQGVPNPIGWLDDTDPGRPSSGRKIQVNARDVSDAVVPLTFLERARSVVKKAVGKVMNPLVERSDSKTRRRAASSVASSSGDTSMFNGPPTTYAREDRRRSLLPDDSFLESMREALSMNKPSQADTLAYDPLATVLPPVDAHEQAQIDAMELPKETFKPGHRHGHSFGHRPSHQLLRRASRVFESQTTPPSPCYDRQRENHGEFLLHDDVRHPRQIEVAEDDVARCRSVDRGLFGASDKRAVAKVGLTHAVAPGTPSHPRPRRSIDIMKAKSRANVNSPLATSMEQTNNEAEDDEELKKSGSFPVSGSRKHTKSNPESYSRVQEALKSHCHRHTTSLDEQAEPMSVPCPPSDDDEWSEHPGAPSRGDTMTTVKSSSTESMDGFGTPLTTPSEVTSPVSAVPPTKNDSEHTFQSDPSLPALLSGASSVSADMEAELLGPPGLVSTRKSLLETTDSLTPPAYEKESTNGFPLHEVFGNPPAMDSGSLTLRVEHDSSDMASEPDTGRSRFSSDSNDEDDEGSDDGILLMAKSKRKSMPAMSPARRSAPFEAKRRDTNISTTSVETAKPADNGDAEDTGITIA